MNVKHPLLLSILLICQFIMAQTTGIHTFDDLMAALNSESRIRVIIHYAKCTGQCQIP
jgi:hypothetical protein